tara:strand:- start:2556 stop:2741 length:186 start_codon:yes stop_codon:yes gene_type:complete
MKGKKIMALSKAAIRAIAIRRKNERNASNDNTPVRAKSAYVDTTMTPGMLAACVEAAGLQS